MSSYIVRLTFESTVTTVAVSGEIDLASAPALKTRIDAIIDHTDGDIGFDLADLVYIDSSGLAVILEARDALAKLDRHLTVVRMSQQVARLFDLCGVTELLSGDPGRPAHAPEPPAVAAAAS